MKIRALVSFAAIEATLSPGQEANVSDEVAKDLIACNYAEPVEDKKTTKKKVVKDDESK